MKVSGSAAGLAWSTNEPHLARCKWSDQVRYRGFNKRQSSSYWWNWLSINVAAVSQRIRICSRR